MQVMFFKGKGIYDDFIRLHEDDVYTHVALVVGDEIWEAYPGHGVRVRKISDISIDENRDIFNIEATPEQEEKAISFAKSQKGKPYGGIVSLVFDHPNDGYDSWFCSKYVFESLRVGGIYALVRTTCGRVRPSDLVHSPLFI